MPDWNLQPTDPDWPKRPSADPPGWEEVPPRRDLRQGRPGPNRAVIGLVIALATVLVLGVGAAGFLILRSPVPAPLPPREEESPEEKQREVAAAFRGDPLGGEKEEARAIEDLFVRL